MVNKDSLSNELENRLKELFVEDFDKVNIAKDNINTYLESINIENKYEYNEFCADFLKVSKKMINSLSLSDIQNLDTLYIMGEIMSVMVKYKILESEPDETKRSYMLIQHELRSNMVRGVR